MYLPGTEQKRTLPLKHSHDYSHDFDENIDEGIVVG